jgi:hypothetical protein
VLLPSVVSTLFPHLPRASLHAFRVALVLGAAVVVTLGGLGLYPVAFAAAVVFVPLLTVLYVWSVDLYEDEPVVVLALTLVWGAVAGVGLGRVDRALLPGASEVLAESSGEQILLRGVALPLISIVLILAGPLVLLPYRKFNDVLDGATFAVASAVTFVAALALFESSALFQEGWRPPTATWPWVVRLLEHGIALPLLAAGAAAGASASLWLRYRTRSGRRALGPFGHPLVALPAAGGLLVAGAIGQLELPRTAALALLLVLDAIALVWLRLVIHVGLQQEAAEIDVGPSVTCANCGDETPSHTFCGRCGIALKALPKRAGSEPADEPSDGLRIQPVLLLGLFALALAAAVGAGALTVGFGSSQPQAPCETLGDCGPVRSSALGTGSPLVVKTPWRSALGFQLEYDPAHWTVAGSGPQDLTLRGENGEVLTIEGAQGTQPADLLEARVAKLRDDLPDIKANADPRREVLGPSIGSRQGIGAVYCGTISTPQGGNSAADVVVLAASAEGGSPGVAVSLVTNSCQAAPNEQIGFLRADAVLNTFRWPGG